MYEPMTTLPEGPVPVSVRHYGVKASSFDLYDDDGRTYDYEKGEFTWIRLVADSAVASGKATVLDDGTIWSFNDYEFKFMTK